MAARPDVVERVRACLSDVEGGLTPRERALLLATVYRHTPDGLDPAAELEHAARHVRALNPVGTIVAVHGLGRLLAAVDAIVRPDPLERVDPGLDAEPLGGRKRRRDVDGPD